jgi:methyl-accepting chemotaxis protein
MRQQMFSDRIDKLRTTTELAHGLATYLEGQVKAGKLTRDAAIAQYRDQLLVMRFDNGVNYLAAATMNGVMLAHPSAVKTGKENLVGQNLMEIVDPNGVKIIKIQVDLMKQKNEGYVEFYWRKEDKIAYPKLNYNMKFEPWDMFIASSTFYDDIEDAFMGAVVKVGALALVLVTAAALILLVISRNISRPLTVLTSRMGELAAGNLDVVIDVEPRRDEIGQMALGLNSFQKQLKSADSLRHAHEAEQLAKLERARQIEEGIGRFEESIGSVLDAVNKAAANLEGTAETMAATSQQTSQQSVGVAAAAEQATAGVQTVASAATELTSSINQIGDQVVASTRMIEQAVEQTSGSDQQVRALAAAAEKIGEVVSLINNIAGQTNLLALNATIEAARAGDAGKGFAVVASEVKALASQTAKATEDITSQVQAIQLATQNSAQSIQLVADTMLKVNSSTSVISTAVESQGAATLEIARHAQDVAQRTTEVSGTVREVSEAAQGLKQSAVLVHEAAANLRRNGLTLRQQVDQFLNRVRVA